jgi:phage FluMu gp28-like protein
MPKTSILLPYQQRWIADTSLVKVCEKSRRIGLTWAEAAYSTLMAARSGPGGTDTWYMGANEAGAEEFILDCAFWAKQYNEVATTMEQVVINDEGRDILAFQIRFASGNRVTGLTSNPTNLRGKQGRVVVDEYAFHPNAEEVRKAAIALWMLGGQISFISTHNGEQNAFNELVMGCRSGKYDYSLHRITLDDALEDGFYKRRCLIENKEWSQAAQDAWREQIVALYGDAANEELFCVPGGMRQIYFPSLLVESRMKPEYGVVRKAMPDEFVHRSGSERTWEIKCWYEEELKPHLAGLNPDERHYFGEDFGRNGDLSVFAVVAEGVNLVRYCPLVVELRNMPFKQQEEILKFLVEGLPLFSGGAMDARGNGQHLAEWAAGEWGESRIAQVKLTRDDYKTMMPSYKAALEDRGFWMPKDADILADHRMVQVLEGVPKIPEGSRLKQVDGKQAKVMRHGDSLIALVLGLAAAMKHPVVERSQQAPVKVGGGRGPAKEIFSTARVPVQIMGRKAARGIF